MHSGVAEPYGVVHIGEGIELDPELRHQHAWPHLAAGFLENLVEVWPQVVISVPRLAGESGQHDGRLIAKLFGSKEQLSPQGTPSRRREKSQLATKQPDLGPMASGHKDHPASAGRLLGKPLFASERRRSEEH